VFKMSEYICAYSTGPTHIKLTVQNNDHAYAEQLIPHSQCVVNYKTVIFRVQILTTLHACASSMMDDRADNFGAAQYQVKYSNFTLDDKFLNLTEK